MQIIYDKMSESQKAVIMTEDEIFCKIPKKAKIDLGDMRNILRQLAIDEYFELIHTEKKGEPVMVITLKKKGIAFERGLVQQKRIGEDMDSTTFISQVHGIPPKQKEKDG